MFNIPKDDIQKNNSLYYSEDIIKDKSGVMKGVTMYKSVYSCRPPVYYFVYPSYVHRLYADHPTLHSPLRTMGVSLFTHDKHRITRLSKNRYLFLYGLPIAKVSKQYSIVKYVMKYNGFSISPTMKYNVCWGYSKHLKDEVGYLMYYQRYSHYKNCYMVARKDLLYSMLNEKKKKHGHLIDFILTSFDLYTQYTTFLHRKKTSEYWIIKPVSSARGEGISIIHSSEEVKQQKGIILV